MNKNHSYGSEEVEHEWVSLGLLHPTYRSCIFYHSIYHDQLRAPPCMAGQVSAIFADAEGLCYLLLGLLRRHLEKKHKRVLNTLGYRKLWESYKVGPLAVTRVINGVITYNLLEVGVK